MTRTSAIVWRAASHVTRANEMASAYDWLSSGWLAIEAVPYFISPFIQLRLFDLVNLHIFPPPSDTLAKVRLLPRERWGDFSGVVTCIYYMVTAD
jgi:hypothetical protein